MVIESGPVERSRPPQLVLYEEAIDSFGPALARLVRSYERDPDKRQDLRQEIHLGLWRSFERFDGRCSLRTWTYRVAHNVASQFVLRHQRSRASQLVSLDAVERATDETPPEEAIDRRLMVERLHELIARLQPPDRQLMILYLEGLDAAEIGDVIGLSAANVATKIHRVKKMLARMRSAGGEGGD
jgi:RNA polymerase sigma-70 factor (ECF subfamily)